METVTTVMETITIVCWKWHDTNSKHTYKAEHVNRWAEMVRQHTKQDHRLVCITDNPTGVEIETIPLWDELSDVKADRWGKGKPQCFRRLKMFSGEMKDLLGPRFMSMDIDCVILRNIEPLIQRKEDFIINKGFCSLYNGSMWMMDAGARESVYKDFDPKTSPQIANRKYIGSDQAWISHHLGKGEKVWTKNDGVVAYNHIKTVKKQPTARIVFFQGALKPWYKSTPRWVTDAYYGPPCVR